MTAGGLKERVRAGQVAIGVDSQVVSGSGADVEARMVDGNSPAFQGTGNGFERQPMTAYAACNPYLAM